METPPRPPDPLQPVLRDVEAELSRRLHEACEAEARGVSSESAAEIRRLEDALLAAAVAAEQALTLRRHMRRREGGERAREPRDREEQDRAEREREEQEREERDRAGGEAQADGVQSAPEVTDAGGAAAPEGDAPPASGPAVREFRDSVGRAWRAWPVTPGLARPGRSTERLLGALHQGWICFEALDSSARRRLPCTRARWAEVRDEELEQLLEQAITAPERKSGRPAAAAGESSEGPAPPG